MTEISAGKASSKYQIHIAGKNLPKSVLNKHIGKKNKVLIISDEGVPKKHIDSIKSIINNKNKHVLKHKHLAVGWNPTESGQGPGRIPPECQ